MKEVAFTVNNVNLATEIDQHALHGFCSIPRIKFLFLFLKLFLTQLFKDIRMVYKTGYLSHRSLDQLVHLLDELS